MIRKSSSDSAISSGNIISRRSFIAVAASATATGLLLPRLSEAQAASTFDYYIGPNGSDANPGTQAQPWAITALQSKSTTIAGKRVGLLDGTYIVSVASSGGSNAGGLQWNAPGCTVAAVNARQAVITTNNGGSYPQTTDPVIQVLGANSTLDGIKFYQSSFNFLRISGSGSVVRNCHFEDIQLSRYTSYTAPGDNVGAIMIASETFPTVVIDNCIFKNIYNNLSNENGNCIGPIYYGGDTTITRCSFFNANIAIGWKSYNRGPLTVQQCYFDSTIEKLAVYGGMSNDDLIPMKFTFTNNIVNRTGYGLDGWNVNHPDTEAISIIRRNTFIIDSTSGMYGIGGISYSNGLTGRLLSGSELHNCSLQDNVFYRQSGSSPILYWQNGRNSSLDLFGNIDFNLYSAVQMVDADGMTYSTLPSWQARTGQDTHSLNATPLFVNANGSAASDYRLLGGPGTSASSDSTDMGAWGGGITQVGCSFSASSGPQPKPPALSGVA